MVITWGLSLYITQSPQEPLQYPNHALYTARTGLAMYRYPLAFLMRTKGTSKQDWGIEVDG
jgi:hypothetical protein